MKKAWRTLAAVSFVGALALSGCVVGSDDGDTGGTSGSSGSSGNGGSAGSTGGSAGSTGGTAGSSGSGGSAGYTCDNADAGTGTPGSCEPEDPTNPDPCQVCVKNNCCVQYEACTATNPNNPCGFGAPDGNGEIFCMIPRIQAGDTPGEAAGACTTAECGTISDATNDLFTCLDTNCANDCQLFQQ